MPLSWVRELSSQPPPLSSVEFQLGFYQMPPQYLLDTISGQYPFLIIPTLTSSPFSEGPSWALGISVHFSSFLYGESSGLHLRSQQWLIPKTLADISLGRPILLVHSEECAHSFSLSAGLPCEVEQAERSSPAWGSARVNRLLPCAVSGSGQASSKQKRPYSLAATLSRELDLWLPSENDHVYSNTTGRHISHLNSY